jgi:RNA polymerase sigma-70 factor (ECF subfamily)
MKKVNEDKLLVSIILDDKSTARAKQVAYSTIYSNYEKRLFFFFKSKIRSEGRIQDLVLVTLEKVFEKMSQYKNEFAFSTWVYTIANNTLIDDVRKSKLNTICIDEESEEFGPIVFLKSPTLNPQQNLERNERHSLVRNAIDMMKEGPVKEVISKYYLEELSFEEIMKHIEGYSKSTLRVNSRRGKEILSKNLNSMGFKMNS